MIRRPSFRAAAAAAAGVLAAAPALAQPCFTWTLLQPASSPPPRSYAGLVYDPDHQRTLLIGGFDGSTGNFGRTDVWAWNGTIWTQLPSLPVGQWDMSAIYDTVRHRVVLFGGNPVSLTDGTVTEFDGTSWTTVVAIGPGASGRAVFDSDRGKMVAFSSSGTFEYDPAQGWTLLTTSGPPFRSRAGMVYDSYRHVIVLFGGIGYRNDLWEFDGASWHQVSLPNPPPGREYPRMAFDAGRGRTILYAGTSSTGAALTDTWKYDGQSWDQLNLGTPSARYGPTIAYDGGSGDVLNFGGQAFNGPLLNEFYRSQTAIPAIVEQPQSIEALEGGFAAFHVRPNYNAGPIFFTWYKNGFPVFGATSAFLSFPAVTQADAGEYRVSIGGQCAAAASVRVTLRVKCYANCDGSTNAPALNVNDFVCFLNRFGTGCPE